MPEAERFWDRVTRATAPTGRGWASLRSGGRVRPNRIGVTVCSVLSVDGTTVHVSGLDAIDGTPVLDLKPFMPEFGPRGDIRSRQWSNELMANYW